MQYCQVVPSLTASPQFLSRLAPWSQPLKEAESFLAVLHAGFVQGDQGRFQ